MQVPTATNLLNEVVVQQALEQAWNDSLPGNPVRRHEEGGWLYMDSTTGNVVVRRALAGTRATLEKKMENSMVSIAGDQVLAVAQADAERVYHDLSPYRIQLVLEDDGWHVDYELKNPRLKGGGPHYIIDAHTGFIVSKRYEQ